MIKQERRSPESRSPRLDRQYSSEGLSELSMPESVPINITTLLDKQIQPIMFDLDSSDTIDSIKGKILTILRSRPNFRDLTKDDISYVNLISTFPPSSNNPANLTVENIKQRLSDEIDIITVNSYKDGTKSKRGGKRKKRRTKRRTNRR